MTTRNFLIQIYFCLFFLPPSSFYSKFKVQQNFPVLKNNNKIIIQHLKIMFNIISMFLLFTDNVQSVTPFSLEEKWRKKKLKIYNVHAVCTKLKYFYFVLFTCFGKYIIPIFVQQIHIKYVYTYKEQYNTIQVQ